MTPADFKNFFKETQNLNLLLIGDLMLDRYLWGEVNRISPEAPVPVVKVIREERTLGGVGNVLKNLVPYGARIHVISVLGTEPEDDFIREELRRLDVSRDNLLTDPQRPASVKTRIMASSQQLIRFDCEKSEAINSAWEDKIIKKLKDVAKQCQVILVSDYAKGIITKRVLEEIAPISKQYSLPWLVDPKGFDYSLYKGCTLVTPNTIEAELAVGFSITTREDVERAGQSLLQAIQSSAVLITRGKEGMTLFQPQQAPLHIPTKAKEVYDVSGAGDTVLAFMGLGIGTGLTYAQSATLANLAAGIVVGKLGAAIAKPEELLAFLSEKSNAERKIKSRDKLALILQDLKRNGKKIVFTNGCFDLLHPGHITTLEGAKREGDILVVGLNSDRSVKEIKGDGRPIISEKDRAYTLSSLACVDYLTFFDEPTPELLIRSICPDVLVKGGDCSNQKIVGQDFVKTNGGTVKFIPFEEGYSTTGILEKIKGQKENE